MSIELTNRITDLEDQVAYWKDKALANASTALLGAISSSFRLTRAEAWVVGAMWRAKGRAVSCQHLQEGHPGDKYGDEREGNNVQVFITRIRKKLGADSIITHRGIGYALSPETMGRIDSVAGELACSVSS
jgi:DNA-binding response OmpR family regulator